MLQDITILSHHTILSGYCTLGRVFQQSVQPFPASGKYRVFERLYPPSVDAPENEDDRIRISFMYDLFALRINRPRVSVGLPDFGGNHIMIRTAGFYVRLCHCKKGSAKVKKLAPLSASANASVKSAIQGRQASPNYPSITSAARSA